MKKTIALIALFMLVYVTAAFAWWSVPTGFSGSTHHKLTDSAEGLLSGSNYPDIIKFGGDVSDWTSGKTDDARAHNLDSEDPATVLNTLLDGGPIGTWWDRAQREYKNNNYNSGDWSTYYYIALMMHLIEDQAVPAHAYNIKHGTPGYMDNMEQMADSNYNPNASGIIGATLPADNYDIQRQASLARTLYLNPSSYWSAYWQYNELTAHPNCTGNDDPYYNYASVYGGAEDNSLYAQSTGYAGCPVDAFPAFWTFAGNNERNLEMDLLGQAVGYTAGALVSVSMNLPPLTKDLAIDGSTDGTSAIDIVSGSNITLKLFENRQPDVYVLITVDSPDGQAIMDADSGTPVSYALRNLGSGTQLPYEGPFAVKWKGMLADGSYTSSGEHTLYVIVYDHDENQSPATTINFKINTPPIVVSTNPANGATNVSTDSPISITFDRAMDTTSVQGAITISPALVEPTFIWSNGNKTVTIDDAYVLDENQTYTVTISDSAMDINGVHLDGDKDGQPGGNYVFSFTTGAQENYKITSFNSDYFDGTQYWVKSGTKAFTIQVVDDGGTPISTTTPPQITCSAGAVSFTNPGAATSTWNGEVTISGGDGPATFSATNGNSLTGIKAFMIDTTPPKLESVPIAAPACNCPSGPIAVQLNATDSGSGVADVVLAGLGLYVNGCYAPGDYEYGATSITDHVGNTASFVDSIVIMSPPGCDYPDDNFSFNGSSVPPSTSNDQSSMIAAYQGGYYYDFLGEMAQINRSTMSITDKNLANALIGTSRVLVIPSGGLYGLKNSDMFKAELDEFVKQGGTLVVFAQQHGYDFSALPVPQEADGTYRKVAGFGWGEDQSCQYNSSYVDTWHQMLSGQSNATPSLNVDGYFTNYPSTAAVILRRVVNGQPSMINYKYGNGQVIATTMYTDYAFGHSQASDDEKALVRDLISWAKSPAQLPEVRPGDPVSVSLQVLATNATSTAATSVKIRVLDPNRAQVLSEQTSAVAIPVGQSVEIPISFSSPATTLGIYHTDYILLDAQGNIIQPQAETDSGRFVVSNAPQTGTINKPIGFSISTDSQSVVFGFPFEYTFHVYNNTKETRNLTIRTYLHHTNRGRTWNVTAGPNAETTLSDSDLFIDSRYMYETLYAYLYDENNVGIGYYMLSFKGTRPSVTVAAQTDKPRYLRSETVNLTLNIQNQLTSNYSATLIVRVMDPSNVSVYTSSFDMTLANNTIIKNLSFGLPINAQIGFYTISAEAYDTSGGKIGGSSTEFELPLSLVSVTPALSSVLYSGTSKFSFDLYNKGKIDINEGVLDISLKDPAGNIMYSGSQSFTLATGLGRTMDFLISLPSLIFGDYILSYTQSDETRQGAANKITIPNRSLINLIADKAAYKIGETANLAVSINNTGKFKQNGTLTFEVPLLGFTDTQTVTMDQGNSITVPYNLTLPITLDSSGTISATFTTSAGEKLTKSLPLSIAPIIMNQKLVNDKPSYRIRENLGLNYIVTNNGNFASPLNASMSLSIADMNYISNSSLILEEGKSTALSFNIPIPDTVSAGTHVMSMKLTLPSGKEIINEASFTVPESSLIIGYSGPNTLNVGGMINLTLENSGGVDTTYTTAKLTIIDNKDIVIYQGTVSGEVLAGVKQALTTIQIPPQTLNGTILLDVQMKDAKTGKSAALFKTLDITGLKASLQTGTNKDIYLNTESISAISNIANGQFGIDNGNLHITVKGTKKTGGMTGDFTNFLPKENWLLNSAPVGVAVGFDGSLYALDSNNNRILKQDSSGIDSHWGSYCSTDSNGDGIADQPCWAQFSGPMGIAVGPDGAVYVADTNNNRIQKFDSNGNFISTWGSYCYTDSNGDGIPDQQCNGQFAYPNGIAVAPDGSVYVTDSNNNRIQKFDSNGNFIAKWGGYCYTDSNWDGIPDQLCDGQFNWPAAIAVAPDGAVYVVDNGNSRIEKFDGNGNFVSKWGSYCSTDTNWDGLPDQDCNGQFYYPYSITTDADGFVYVADSGNQRIQKFDSNGIFVSKWGKGGSGPGEFSWPYGIAVAPGRSEYVYVADNGNGRIQKFDTIGTYISEWGSSAEQFTDPYSVAVSPDGSIYVADYSNSNIQKFDSAGNFITKWGSYCSTDSNGDGFPDQPCDGQFADLSAVAVSPDGSVYVTDSDNYRILKFDSAGNFIAKWGSYCSTDSNGDGIPDQPCDGQFAYPYGIAVAPDGSVYVTDSNNNRILKFDSNGNFIAKWGSYCYTDNDGDGIPDQPCEGQFAWPSGIAVGPDSIVYVVDYDNSRVEKFDSNGVFISAWGSYCATDSDWDGIPDQACDGQFAGPDMGITVASDGAVYVADSDNYRIQKFDGNGNFIAKWGGTDSSGNELFAYPEGMAVGPDGSVYVADDGNSIILKMAARDSAEMLFTKSIPISQTNNLAQDYTIDIGVLNAPGKLYLQAEFKNSLGQTIATAEYPFYIVAGNTVLVFGVDKKYYRLGETVTITGRIENRATTDAVDLNFLLNAQFGSQDSQQLYTTTVDVPAGGSYPFSATTTADLEGIVTLNGVVTQNTSTLAEMSDQYEVSKPRVIATLSTPDVAGNEPFVINMEMKNVGKVDASLQYVLNSTQGLAIDDQQITIPAGGTKLLQYNDQITNNTAYVCTFTGDLEQILQKTVVFGAKAIVQPTIQPVYGEGIIIIPYIVDNLGTLESSYPVLFTVIKDNQVISSTSATFTIPAGKGSSGSLSYNLGEGQYNLRYETTGYQAESQINVIKPGQGVITLSSINDIFPEGSITIPYTITNTGPLDSKYTVRFGLGTGVMSKSVFIPAGQNYADELQYSLTSGDYTITASITSYPSVTVNRSFKVLKNNYATIDVLVGTAANGQIPVSMNVANIGYNSIDGIVQLSIFDSQGISVWSGEQTINQLTTNNLQLVTFSINSAGIPPGSYTATTALLNNGREQLAANSASLMVQGALFQITQVPTYQTFYPDQEATFIFKVKNIGNQEGPADLAFKAYDLIDLTRTEWLKPGEEKEISFAFTMPADLEEKDYFADYELKGQGAGSKGQAKYHFAGINLTVEASLDKQNYAAGDIAHLTLTINQQSTAVGENLFARINYSGYDQQRPFTLNSSQTLVFDVPLTQITEEKLLYGIYYTGGRSIHLNNIYVYKADDMLTITTDKQVYDPGNVVALEVRSQNSGVSGQMTLTGPSYTETFAFNGSATKSFTLPMTMTAGTYNIGAQLKPQNSQALMTSHPIDVNGIKVKIIEVNLDKGKYAETDSITANLTMTSNRDAAGTLKMWIVDPQGKRTPAGETSIMLSSSEPLLVTHDAPLATEISGIHRLSYQVYAGDLLVSAGSEAFDVGDAALLGLSTDKSEYPAINEPVAAKVNMIGTIEANLELQLDGVTIKNEAVTLNGIYQTTMVLGTVSPGTHVLKAILTAGGLSSTQQTSFMYGSSLPDLTVTIGGQATGMPRNGKLDISVTVLNQGRSIAGATTVSLYDGDSLIETKAVRELPGGETDTIVFSWNVIGKSGDHTLKVVVDPQNIVVEFNENNNTSFANIRIPADTMPPVTTIAIGTPKLAANGSTIVSSSTQFTLSAVDNSSGVAGTEYRVDDATWTIYAPFSITTEGTHTISYRSQDNEGNREEIKNLTVIADVTPPTGSIIINDGAAYTNNSSVTLTLNCTDPASGCTQMQFSNDSTTWSTPETYVTTKAWALASGDGPKTVYVKYHDSVENPSAAYSAGITLNTIPPVPPVTTASPAGGLYKTAQSVTLSANEPATIYYTTDGTMPTTGSSVYSGPISVAQTATIRFFAVSDFGISEQVKTVSYTIDTQPPVLSISALPDGSYSNNAILNIAGTASDANGVQSMIVSGQTVTTSTSDNVNYSFNYPVTLATGSNIITTVVIDNAGNTTTDTRIIILDLTAPVITITHPSDNSVTNEITPSVTGTTDKTATILISLGSGPSVTAAVNAMIFSLPVTLATNTINTIFVYATDLAGNPGSAKRTVTHDDTKPALAITVPNQDMGTNQAGIVLSGTVSDLTDVSLLVTCPTASIGFVSTPTSTTWSVDITNMQQGTNTFTVQATDQAGNSTSVIRNIIYSQTPITIDPVKTLTNINQQQLTGTMELNSTVMVSCPTATVGTIINPTTTTWQVIIAGMTEGANSISATATDLEGHTSNPVFATIVLDTQAPDTSIQTGPAAITNQNAAGFSFISTEQGSTFECELDNGTYNACTGPMNYNSLIDGTHTFMVRATDSAGNTDKSPAVYTWTVDTVPPIAVIIGVPPSLSNVRSASLTVVGDDVIAYQYSLDSGVFSAETSTSTPISLAGLLDGTHKVLVTGKDSAGNWQKYENATPANWTVDITPPVLIVSTLPDGSYTNNPLLNVAGTASDANGIQSVVVSGQTVTIATTDNVSYTFSQAVTLATGSNPIITTAKDNAENPTTDIRTLILDQNAPKITITNPADNSLTNEITTTVTGTVDKIANVSIKVNGISPLPDVVTRSTFMFPVTLAYNDNLIEVTAVDLANNKGTAKRSVKLDNLSPALAITIPNQDMGTDRPGIAMSGTVSDLTAVSLLVTCPTASIGDVSRPTSTTWSVNVTNMQQGTNTVTVQATDQAGNSTSVVRNIISSQTPVTIDPVKTPTKISQQTVTGTRELNSAVTVTCTTAVVGVVSTPTPTTWQVIIASMTEGANIISATATDLEGNTAVPATATIILDTHAPVTTPSPAPGTYYNTVTVTLAANELAMIYYTMDGTTPTSSSKVYSGPLALTATTTLKFFAIDMATNSEAVKSVTFTVIPDTTPPVTTITTGSPNYTSGNGKLYVTSASLFSLSATDNISGVKTTAYHIDGGTWTTYVFPFSLLSEGTHTIGYMSTDNASNAELEKSISPVVDNTPPVSSITVGGTPVTPSTAITITATDTASGVRPIEYNIDGSAWTSYSGSFTLAPYSQGTHTINYRSTDNVGNVETPKTRTVQLWTDRPIITITALADGTVGASYSQTLAAMGGTAPYLWSIATGTLPAGLALTGTTGTISGTPTSAGTSTMTFQVSDVHSMTNTKVLSLTIYGPVSITTGTLATGTTGTSYSQRLSATGGKTPYTWSISAGSLPSGLLLNNSTGVISGTPTSAGIPTFTVQAKDANNATSTKPMSIAIYAPLTISTVSLLTGTTGIAYSQTFAATGGLQPYVWSTTTGTLPAGLSLNSSTGVLSGTPSSAGTSTFTTQVKDANNLTSSKLLAITINSALSIPQNLGVFSATGITMSGGYIDSYDSTQGAYNGVHGSNVSVGTNSTTNGAITLSGGVVDYGNAYVGPGGNPAKVITTSGGAVINGTKGALSKLKNMTPMSDPGGGTQTTFTNGTTLTSGTYRVSSINLSGSGKGTINGNVTLYVTGSVNLSGSSQIAILPGSSLTIYINGSLNVSGGSIVNQTLNTRKLTIYGTSTCTSANYSGSGALYGVIYTPAASTSISGLVNVYGSVNGGSIAISGGAAVHYDASLGNIGL